MLQGFVQRRVQARNTDHHGHPADIESPAYLRTGERIRQHYRHPQRKRRKQPDDAGIDMVRRQRQQHTIVLAHQLEFGDAINLPAQLGVAQRHSLGWARGAGGVEKHGRVVRLR